MFSGTSVSLGHAEGVEIDASGGAWHHADKKKDAKQIFYRFPYRRFEQAS